MRTIAKLPIPGDDRRHAIVTMRVRLDCRVRRYEQQDGVKACGSGIAGQDFCVNAREFRTADLVVALYRRSSLPSAIKRISGIDGAVAPEPTERSATRET